MINKAFLHPWVRRKMSELVDEGTRRGLAPVIRSGFRESATQIALFKQCGQAAPGQRGFPALESPCSQHEWGFAFDAQATSSVMPRGSPPPSRQPGLSAALCALFPDLCAPSRRFDQAPLILGDIGRSLGLRWSRRDEVHFGAFAGGEWTNHMRSVWGFPCRTCTYPGGTPI